MSRRRLSSSKHKLVLLLLGAVLLFCASENRAQSVITHPTNHLTEISESTLRAIYGMRVLEWPDGTPITVFVLSQQNQHHNEFCKNILHVFPYQLQRTWNRLIFSGSGQAPISLRSAEEMLERVQETPGAIGYLPEGKVNDHVRILLVQ